MHPVRMLIVEPDDDTRALYREMFHGDGWDIVEAADGREALAKALTRPPALVVTEIRLPFLDGYELCEILRRDRATTSVPILVVTAEPRLAGTKGRRRVEANLVLTKPTSPEDVLAATRRLLSEARDGGGSSAPPVLPLGQPSDPRLSKSFTRFVTITPPASPPQLVCPSCDEPLAYEHSFVGGVSAKHPEQWDTYVCPRSCGTFEYRHRTRKLRKIDS
jgi:DNA-binding response OmpR family regulator